MLKQSEVQEERSGTKGRFSMYQTQPVQECTQGYPGCWRQCGRDPGGLRKSRGEGWVVPLTGYLREARAAPFIHSCILSLAVYLAPGGLGAPRGLERGTHKKQVMAPGGRMPTVSGEDCHIGTVKHGWHKRWTQIVKEGAVTQPGR